MKRETPALKRLNRSIVLTLFLLLTGCGLMEPIPDAPARPTMAQLDNYDTRLYRQPIERFTPYRLQKMASELHLVPKVEQVIFLVDGAFPRQSHDSQVSDNNGYDIVRRFSHSMPRPKIKTVLITSRNLAQSNKNYNENEFDEVVVTTSPIDNRAVGVNQLVEQFLSESDVPTAVILVTENMAQPARKSDITSQLQYVVGQQRNACFYNILMSMRNIASFPLEFGKCGFSLSSKSLSHPREMSHFVGRVLFKGPADSDGDGIYDYRDRCPDTSVGRVVNYDGCYRFESGR